MMNELVKVGGITLKVDKDALEPNDFFTIVKSAQEKTTIDGIKKQLAKLSIECAQARELGQTTYLNKLVFSANCVMREQILLQHGFVHFVSEESVTNYITKVQPKGSVRLIELSRFSRPIPLEAAQKIKKAKELDVFDDIIILYTDLTGPTKKTPEEQAYVNRNRDPIAFGIFKHEESGTPHQRLFVIADWQDEYCDLTYSKLIAMLPDPPGVLMSPGEYDFVQYTQTKKEVGQSWMKKLTKHLNRLLLGKATDG